MSEKQKNNLFLFDPAMPVSTDFKRFVLEEWLLDEDEIPG